MPLYEYVCADCGEQFEVLVRTGTALECPQCQSTELERQMTVFATVNPCSLPVECAPCGATHCYAIANGEDTCEII